MDMRLYTVDSLTPHLPSRPTVQGVMRHGDDDIHWAYVLGEGDHGDAVYLRHRDCPLRLDLPEDMPWPRTADEATVLAMRCIHAGYLKATGGKGQLHGCELGPVVYDQAALDF